VTSQFYNSPPYPWGKKAWCSSCKKLGGPQHRSGSFGERKEPLPLPEMGRRFLSGPPFSVVTTQTGLPRLWAVKFPLIKWLVTLFCFLANNSIKRNGENNVLKFYWLHVFFVLFNSRDRRLVSSRHHVLTDRMSVQIARQLKPCIRLPYHVSVHFQCPD
jgi:hypothetical protein